MPPARSPRTERTLAALRVVFLAHGAPVQEFAALRVLEYNFFGEGRWTTLAQSMRLERVRAMAALGNVIGQGRPGRVEAVLRKVEMERMGNANLESEYLEDYEWNPPPEPPTPPSPAMHELIW